MTLNTSGESAAAPVAPKPRFSAAGLQKKRESTRARNILRARLLDTAYLAQLIRGFRESGRWMSATVLAELLGRDGDSVRRRLYALAEDGYLNRVTSTVETPSGMRSTAIFEATKRGYKRASVMSDADVDLYSIRVPSAARSAPDTEANTKRPTLIDARAAHAGVQELVFEAVGEWHSIMNEWPNYREIVQWIEDVAPPIITVALRKLTGTGSITPLQYSDPYEVRYRITGRLKVAA
jgi:DNA-binding Lrp family transcriptional regulator